MSKYGVIPDLNALCTYFCYENIQFPHLHHERSCGDPNRDIDNQQCSSHCQGNSLHPWIYLHFHFRNNLWILILIVHIDTRACCKWLRRLCYWMNRHKWSPSRQQTDEFQLVHCRVVRNWSHQLNGRPRIQKYQRCWKESFLKGKVENTSEKVRSLSQVQKPEQEENWIVQKVKCKKSCIKFKTFLKSSFWKKGLSFHSVEPYHKVIHMWLMWGLQM